MTSLLVKKKDGSVERVEVTFPAEKIIGLLRFTHQPLRLIDIHCGKPEGWSQTLDAESQQALGNQIILAFVDWMAVYERYFLALTEHHGWVPKKANAGHKGK